VPLGRLMIRWLIVLSPILLVVLFASLKLLQSSSYTMAMGALMRFLVFLPLAFLMTFLLWPVYRIGEFRTFMNGTSIGPVHFVSQLQTQDVYMTYLGFMARLLFSLIVLGLVLGILGSTVGAWNFKSFNPNSPPIATIAVTMIGYLSSFVVFAGLKELYLNQPFWRLAVGSLGLINLDAANDVIGQSVSEEAATGEGIGDALEFGGI
jgi:Bacterial protein of unknown function (DUF898)